MLDVPYFGSVHILLLVSLSCNKSFLMDKRTFLKSTSMAGLASLASFSGIAKMVEAVAHLPAAEVAKDDDFWLGVAKSNKFHV